MEASRPRVPGAGSARALRAVPAPVGVWSEAGRLHRVLLHRPGPELERLTPANMDELLFDDLPWPERARAEHDAFAAVLRAQGVEVLLLGELLDGLLEDADARAELIDATLDAAPEAVGALHQALADHLRALDARGLSHALVAGVAVAELDLPAASFLRLAGAPEAFALAPLPNAMFTRDSSVWTGLRVELCALRFPARRREQTLLGALHASHPAFAGGSPAAGAGVEGGDVLMAGDGTVVVGMGERTGAAALEAYATALLASRAAERVLAVAIPDARASMHLDTLMSFVDHDTLVAHPIVEDLACWRLDRRGAQRTAGVRAALTEALDRPVTLLSPAAAGPAAERAQWADAHNVLAVAPGVVVAYDRTPTANRALREAGIEVLEIEGGELGRGRGGPRCLSCPVSRSR